MITIEILNQKLLMLQSLEDSTSSYKSSTCWLTGSSPLLQVTGTLQKELLMCSHQFLLWFSDTKPPGTVYYILALLSHIVHTLCIGWTWFCSLPYLIWCRKNLNCKLYAHSLIGVGVASSLYHASGGRLRKYLRWADYATIATATVVHIFCYIGNLFSYH